MYVAMKGTEGSALDRSLSLMLLFAHYREPQGSNADGDQDEARDDGIHEDDNTTKRYYDEDDEDDETTNKSEDAETKKKALFFYSISRRRSVCKRMDDLQDHLYWATPDGWLLMAHPGSRLTFLWNPFTRQRIPLPLDQDEFLTRNPVRCVLSHEPTDPSCVVLVVSCVDAVLWHCRPGATQWSEHAYYQAGSLMSLRHSRNDAIDGMSLATAMGGKFYVCLLETSTILALEFSPGPTFTETPVAEQSDPVYRRRSYRLLESRGELFSLCIYHPLMECGDKVARIVVRRLDLSARSWVEVDTIGDRVFLVDAFHFAASLGAKEAGLKGNCVYYLRRGEKGLYVYNMERGTTTMHNPGPNLPDDATAVILMPVA